MFILRFMILIVVGVIAAGTLMMARTMMENRLDMKRLV